MYNTYSYKESHIHIYIYMTFHLCIEIVDNEDEATADNSRYLLIHIILLTHMYIYSHK
jgi:hypothetical protein